MSTTHLVNSVLILAAAAVGGWIMLTTGKPAQAQAPVTRGASDWTPATIRIREVSSMTAGPTFERKTFTAIRKDGSMVTGDDSPVDDRLHYGVRTVTLLDEGTSTLVDDMLKRKTTTYLLDQDIERRRQHPEPPCTREVAPGVKQRMTGSTVLLGSTATIVESEYDGVKTTLWYATGLNCAIIRQLDEIRHNGAEIVTDRLERTPTEIRLGDPDPSAFDVPADYVETLPSQLRAARAELRGSRVPSSKVPVFERKDEKYLGNLRAARDAGRRLPPEVERILQTHSSRK